MTHALLEEAPLRESPQLVVVGGPNGCACTALPNVSRRAGMTSRRKMSGDDLSGSFRFFGNSIVPMQIAACSYSMAASPSWRLQNRQEMYGRSTIARSGTPFSALSTVVNMKTANTERWSAELVRIGNQAVREAQTRNRQLGIPNWYSLNGKLVSDAPQVPIEPVAGTKAR